MKDVIPGTSAHTMLPDGWWVGLKFQCNPGCGCCGTLEQEDGARRGTERRPGGKAWIVLNCPQCGKEHTIDTNEKRRQEALMSEKEKALASQQPDQDNGGTAFSEKLKAFEEEILGRVDKHIAEHIMRGAAELALDERWAIIHPDPARQPHVPKPEGFQG